MDIYQIKEQRASSYIDTPERFENKPKFGLVNLHDTCDNECFKWRILYHQSENANNGYRLTVVKNIQDKYLYDVINSR